MKRLLLNKNIKNAAHLVSKNLKRCFRYIIINHNLKKYDLDKANIFESVEIETINRCNGKCSFCPVNARQPQRPYAKMSDELFHKLIDELSQMDYHGNLALFSNNEPFLDERIIDFYKIAREKCPHCFLHIFTNGSLLTLDKFKEIIPALDRMVIDNYADDKTMKSNVSILYDYCQEHKEWEKKVRFMLRKENEILFSRGGQAPNKGMVKTLKTKCLLPFSQLIIRPDGKISLCCNDALGKYTLGDANSQSLLNIWFSQPYREIRKSMKQYGRKQLLLCKGCDTTQDPWNNSRK